MKGRKNWKRLCLAAEQLADYRLAEMSRLAQTEEYWQKQFIGMREGRSRDNIAFAGFMRDIQLITVAGTHMLCGSFWIRGESLLEAIRRYSETP